MTAVVDGLRACYLGVVACMGVAHAPPPPRVEIVPNVPHTSLAGVKNAPGFACGEYADGSTAYCAGLSSGRWVVVSTHTMEALPHEFVHWVVKQRRLNGATDRADSEHTGPWWHCETKQNAPACAGLWR